MLKEMSWLPMQQENENMALHLRTAINQPWKPYTAFPEYAAPDYPIAEGSKGFATYHKLRLQGWNLIPTSLAKKQYFYS
jgi:hypothetical protein